MQNYCNSKSLRFLRFLIVMIIYVFMLSVINKAVFGKCIKVSINSKFYGINNFKIYYTNNENRTFNDEMSYKTEPTLTNNFRNFSCSLPTKDIQGLKINLGSNYEEILIKNITIKTSFKIIKFNAKDVKKIFNNVSPEVKNITVKDNVLHVIPKGIDPYIYNNDLSIVIKKYNINYNLVLVLIVLSMILTILSIQFYNYLLQKDINTLKLMLILMFMFILYIPNLFSILGIKLVPNTEQRNSPTIDLDEESGFLQNKIRGVEAKYNDNFGTRNLLIKLNSLINLKVFNVPSVDKVLLGKEGWLYYAREEQNNLINKYRGINKFTATELWDIKKNLEQRKKWLNKKGIPFILVIAPDKETIYPEYYNNLKYKKVNDETKLDQLLEYLNKNSDLEVVDLRKTLTKNKNNGALYYKTDTHWNEFGAYFAYKDIIEYVKKYINVMNPLDITEFDKVEEKRESGGDLAKMLNLPNQFKESQVFLKPKIQRKAIPSLSHNYDLIRGDVIINSNKEMPKLLMFRDSFTVALLPFISEHFSESVYEWSYSFNGKLVEQINPNIVIQEVVERNIDQLLLSNPTNVR